MMALTNPQRFEILGRTLYHGLKNIEPNKNRGRRPQWVQKLATWSKNFRTNGSHGRYSQAEINEAMVDLRDFLYEATTGNDPATNAHDLAHWQNQVEDD